MCVCGFGIDTVKAISGAGAVDPVDLAGCAFRDAAQTIVKSASLTADKYFGFICFS
jgi:hypothetical protein